jgi:hypothetical protein
MQSYLFIGGHQDGLSIPLTDDVEYVQLADGDTGRETYIRDTLAVGAFESITFYRHEGLTPEEVLDLLAKHYIAWCVNRPRSRW